LDSYPLVTGTNRAPDPYIINLN